MEATKDRATEYWDNEIKRAAEDTRLAYRNYEKARRVEHATLKRVREAKERRAPKDELLLLLKERKMVCAQTLEAWGAFTYAQKWERATKESARQ